MSTAIICEYNPFHNGHLHQINKIKQERGGPIICIMSGNFTQRGEIAVADKYTRAEMALRSGADLVLELPFPYCASSAEYFASAGVEIAASCRADVLSFGSECADMQRLEGIARITASNEFKEKYALLAKEKGNTSAYFSALSLFGISNSELSSNDILGVEYIKAINSHGYKINPRLIKREGIDYSDSALKTGFNPSATAIREELFGGELSRLTAFLPDATFNILKSCELADPRRIKDSILLCLRLLSTESTSSVAISDVGLVNRILSSAREARGYDDFEKRVSCKKYTDSAIRRAILYMLVGVTADDLKVRPAYTTLLGAGPEGRALLAKLRKSEQTVPIITKPADASEVAKRQMALSLSADSIFTMAYEPKKDAAEYIRKSPVMI